MQEERLYPDDVKLVKEKDLFNMKKSLEEIINLSSLKLKTSVKGTITILMSLPRREENIIQSHQKMAQIYLIALKILIM